MVFSFPTLFFQHHMVVNYRKYPGTFYRLVRARKYCSASQLRAGSRKTSYQHNTKRMLSFVTFREQKITGRISGRNKRETFPSRRTFLRTIRPWAAMSSNEVLIGIYNQHNKASVCEVIKVFSYSQETRFNCKV